MPWYRFRWFRVRLGRDEDEVRTDQLTRSADEMVWSTLADCLQYGEYVKGSKDNSWELLNYQTGITEPKARIMTHGARPLNPVVAVARFVWLMAGNNRVEDIAFYEPKVRGFSDDGLSVPGSDYGLRLVQPRPGLNQIYGVVERLREDYNTRQAAAVVWQPEDAVRQSGDIPCTFGMFFKVTSGGLNMTTIMRSNNAFRILPFNIFEFTMLQELVAAQLEIPIGDYVHWAASMHAYDNERETPPTKRIAESDGQVQSITMPVMPAGIRGDLDSYPLAQANFLAQYEAQMRHACTEDELWVVWNNATARLDRYWLELLAILFHWKVAKMGLFYADHDVQLPEYWSKAVKNTIERYIVNV